MDTSIVFFWAGINVDDTALCLFKTYTHYFTLREYGNAFRNKILGNDICAQLVH